MTAVNHDIETKRNLLDWRDKCQEEMDRHERRGAVWQKIAETISPAQVHTDDLHPLLRQAGSLLIAACAAAAAYHEKRAYLWKQGLTRTLSRLG